MLEIIVLSDSHSLPIIYNFCRTFLLFIITKKTQTQNEEQKKKFQQLKEKTFKV